MKIRIFGFILFAVGVVLTVLMITSLWNDVPVWFFGQKTTATIEEKWWEDIDVENTSQGVLNLNYFFEYRFTTAKGEEVLGTSKVTEEEFISYLPGGEISIKYSKLNPSINRIDDSRFVPFLFCFYSIFFIVSIFTLVAGREMLDF